jgi:hypothetical protein
MKLFRVLLLAAPCVVPAYSAGGAHQRVLLETSLEANATEAGSGHEKHAKSTAGGTSKADQGTDGSGTNIQGGSGTGAHAKQSGGNKKKHHHHNKHGQGGGGGGGAKHGGGQSGTKSTGTTTTGKDKSKQDGAAATGGGSDSAWIDPAADGGTARRLRARPVDPR